MSRTGHHPAALAAAFVGAAAALLAESVDPVTFLAATIALGLAYGRRSGWRISRVLERPRLFSALSFAYVPLLFLDLFFSAGVSPVHALIRLVVFLLAAEVLAGSGDRPHRPILLGLLLLVSAAAETTEVWFALPVSVFAIGAVAAQFRTTLVAAQPEGAQEPKGIRLGAIATIVGASFLLGGLFFFAIPRVGAGWGRQLAVMKQEAGLETGLADTVSLGTVGRVKLRRRVAFTARLTGDPVNPETIYWRGRTYAHWTGSGWVQGGGEPVSLSLRAGRPMALPGEIGTGPGGLVAEIEMRLNRSPALVAPGRPVWVRAPWNAMLLATPDGSLSGPEGRVLRRYEVGVRPIVPRNERGSDGRSGAATPPGPGAGGASPGNVLVARPQEGLAPQEGAPPGDPLVALQGGPAPQDRARSDPATSLGGDYEGGGLEAPERPETDPYLETDPLDPEVESWASSLGRAGSDPERIAEAFVAELGRRPYSLDTRAIDPKRPLASFLEGAPAHCEYFASAMALGLRVRGIPARVVGGYLGAERAPFSQEFVVRESRAHLWVEARLPQVGWTTFDPTPEEGRVPPSAWSSALRGGWERAVLAWDSMVIGLDMGDQVDMILSLRAKLLRAMNVLAAHERDLAVGAILLVLLLVMKVVRRGRGAGMIPGLPVSYRRFLRIASRRGLRPAPAETAREFAARAATAFGEQDGIRLISALYERERFGGRAPTPDETIALDRALARLARLAVHNSRGVQPATFLRG